MEVNVNFCLTIKFLYMQSLNVGIEFYILLCDQRSSLNYYWQILVFVYLALLQVIGIILAFQTRRIKFKGLRDSKFIAAIIYISSIVLVVLAVVTFILRVYINVSGGIYAGGVLILTTMFLSLIFIPKVGTYILVTIACSYATVTSFVSSL